jgi:cell division protein FtsQ
MLHIDVVQKKAIVRISPKEGKDFYMDSEGSIFGLSHNYTEHLLIANGNIHDSTDFMTVLDLAKYLSSDSLWNTQIVQIYLKENKEIELVPRVGNHTILLGDITNYQEKLRKLFLFYDKGVNQVGWNDYKEINLKFRNQIVCVKR